MHALRAKKPPAARGKQAALESGLSWIATGCVAARRARLRRAAAQAGSSLAHALGLGLRRNAIIERRDSNVRNYSSAHGAMRLNLDYFFRTGPTALLRLFADTRGFPSSRRRLSCSAHRPLYLNYRPKRSRGTKEIEPNSGIAANDQRSERGSSDVHLSDQCGQLGAEGLLVPSLASSSSARKSSSVSSSNAGLCVELGGRAPFGRLGGQTGEPSAGAGGGC